MSRNVSELPKRIWFCWFQGMNQAPEVVRICHESWLRHNPDWEVVVVDEENAGTFVKGDNGWGETRLPIEKRANLLRLALLERYGGVWVDATCFCTESLDNWIHDCITSGFFAFREDGGKRVLANWFLASLPENRLIGEFRKVHTAYWMENRFRNPGTFSVRAITGLFERLLSLNRRWRDAWFSPTMCNHIRVYPYFAFHYQVAWLLRRNERCRRIFDEMPFRDATPLLEPGRLVRRNETLDLIRQKVQANRQPLYKLNWKHPVFQHDVEKHVQTMFGGGDPVSTGMHRVPPRPDSANNA